MTTSLHSNVDRILHLVGTRALGFLPLVLRREIRALYAGQSGDPIEGCAAGHLLRLQRLERFLGPLSRSAEVEHRGFVAACRCLRRRTQLSEIQDSLVALAPAWQPPPGLDLDGDNPFYVFFRWVGSLGAAEHPAEELYCLACTLAYPPGAGKYQKIWDAIELYCVQAVSRHLFVLCPGIEGLLEWLDEAAGVTFAEQKNPLLRPAALASSRLHDILLAEYALAYLVTWAGAIATNRGRGPAVALGVVSDWLGLPASLDWAEPSSLWPALAASAPFRALPPVGPLSQGQAIQLLYMVAERALPSPAGFAAAWEGWLGLSPEDYRDPRRLAEAYGRPPFALFTDSPHPGHVVASLASSLNHSGRPADAVAAVEAFLALPCGSTASMPSWLGPSAVSLIAAHIEGDLESPGLAPGAATKVAAAWLTGLGGLVLDSGAPGPRPARGLGWLLGRCDFEEAVRLLCVSAQVFRRGLGPGATAEMLESWLEIDPGAYRNPTHLAARLAAVQQSGLEDGFLGASSELWLTHLVAEWAFAVAAAGGDEAVGLLTAWQASVHEIPVSHPTGTPASRRYLTAVALLGRDGDHRETAARLVGGWLGVQVADSQRCSLCWALSVLLDWLVGNWDHPEADDTHCLLVAGNRTHLQASRPTLDCCTKVVRLMYAPWRDFLEWRAERSAAAGDAGRRAELEAALLELSELYRNLEILVRLLAPPSGEPAIETGLRLSSGNWPLRVRPPDNRMFRDGYLPVCRPEPAAPPPASRALDENPAPAAPGWPHHRLSRAERLGRLRQCLTDDWGGPNALLPPGAVLLRLTFDGEGWLRWRAAERGEDGLRVLAAGTSPPGAEARLTASELAFDAAVELAWTAADSRHPRPLSGVLPAGDLQAVRAWVRARLEKCAEPSAAARAGLDRAVKTLERRLPAVGRLLSAMTRASSGDADPSWPEFWRTVWLDAGADTVWPGEAGSPERDDFRREALARATDSYLAALRREIDLSPLWAVHTAEHWSRTDVLFQAEGPLLSAPLAWLPFGGNDLFQSVASTSSVLSLTLRHLAEVQAASAPPARRIVSAQWLPPADWTRGLRGPAALHDGLRRLGRRAGWEVYGLGDEPAATAPNLRAAVHDPLGSGGVLVVGGHGWAAEAGVCLADGVWCGGDCDLGSTDLVVLAACAVGRLGEARDATRDVTGLVAALTACGARSTIAARWPVADTETATFVVELLTQYIQDTPAAGPFPRARALNRARRRLLEVGDPAVRVSRHVAAAFELYNLG